MTTTDRKQLLADIVTAQLDLAEVLTWFNYDTATSTQREIERVARLDVATAFRAATAAGIKPIEALAAQKRASDRFAAHQSRVMGV